jgi:hypothetical protein
VQIAANVVAHFVAHPVLNRTAILFRMLNRLLRVPKHERRIVLLLGSFSFLVLAATTIQGAAAEAIFIDFEGAERLPYGIMLSQLAVIPGFYAYRWLRRSVPAIYLNPAIVVLLAVGLGVVYYLLARRSTAAVYAIMALVPLYASVLAAESVRLTSALTDPRSARRLFPVLGSIGGAGASFGAWLVTVLAARFGQAALLPLAGLLLLLVAIPASAIKESMRPRVSTRTVSLNQLLSKRYVVVLLAAGGLLIAISTVVRYQFGAAAQASFSGDALGVFYGQFALVLNLASIAFTLFVSRALVEKLGAARSLLVYPGAVGAIAAVGGLLPGLAATIAAQFAERLFRQNVHNSSAAIVGMPLDVAMRARMGLVATGHVQPLAVVLTSLAILYTAGELAPPQWRLDWTQLYWPIAVLAGAMLALLWYVRVQYPQEIKSALHARRLRLEDENVDVALPVDGHLRLLLQGYLASDLPERVALALELLRGHEDEETMRLVQRHWPLWPEWLRVQAVGLYAGRRVPEALEFLRHRLADEPDEVSAALIDVLATETSSEQLWAVATANGGPQTRARALAALRERADPRADQLLERWLQAAKDRAASEAAAVAKALARWPDGRFDSALPELLPHAPADVLRAIALRPRADLAPLAVRCLADDESFPFAREALRAIGDAAVGALEQAAVDPRGPSASSRVLATLDGRSARIACLRLMAHHDAAVRRRAITARLHSGLEPSAAERALANENLDESLVRCERFHHYMHRSQDVARRVAASELGAALEDVFLNLKLGDPAAPYRQAYLAHQSPDPRQRSFAVELLDEVLPSKIKHRLLPVLEDKPGRRRFDMEADRHWLDLEQRLEQRTPGGVELRALKASVLFADWRVSELELRLDPAADDDAQIVLREGRPRGLERTLLTGKSVEAEQGDLRLPLATVYGVTRRAPRCAQLWLKCLAELVPETTVGEGEVTRSGMVSLASRSAGEDRAAANGLDLWQRMFFLRSNPLTQDLPAARLRLMAEISRSLTARAGELIVHEGRLGHHFYLVCSGRMRVSSAGQIVAELGPSDGFGALELMRGRRRLLSVHASEDSELIAISRVDFLDLLESHPSLVRSFSRILAAQILAAAAQAPVGTRAA